MLGINADRNYATVLLVDDDLISREVIATILTMSGHTLHTASDGLSAVAMLEESKCEPQVILVDVQMPGLNGAKLIEKLRTLSDASIYAISGSGLPADLETVVDGFLLKPFSPESLQKLLDQNDRTASHRTEVTIEEPVVSAKILSQFRQMMPEPTVREVYVAVVSDLKKRGVALEEAIARKDAVAVRRIGHTIKGGCGMAGARQAARLGGLLEAESDDLNNSASIRHELKLAQENLERMLEVEFPR
ncbi:MAG TPA: response regulator [Terracidiphilus sp.]|jgi:CheY-like chemotaxis protein/HPt (histidine-containing phosphotransfer) domain-containing protein|nr:response regulator [Terracidiphilus sp.]